MQGSPIYLYTQKTFLNFSLRKKTKTLTLLTAFCFTIISCGGGSGGGVPAAPEPVAEVKGTAFIGFVSSGTVDVYSFNGGVRGSSLGSSKVTTAPISTDPLDKDHLEGNYIIALQTSSKAILVCLSDATYQEMTQDRLISFIVAEKQELCAVENYVSGSPLTVMLTYYSHVASGLAKHLAKSGETPSVAVTKANQEIADWTVFNPNIDNPVNVRYTPLVKQESMSQADRAGLANAAISVYSGWVNGVAGIPPQGKSILT